MKIASAFVAALALMTAGCVLSGKGKKPVPPAPVAARPPATAPPAPAPQPLSVPQTQVELPHPQPVDPAALSVDAPPRVETAEPAPPPRQPASRRPSGAPQPSRAEPPPVTPPAAPAEAPAPQIQEIVPAAEIRRLQEQAAARRRDVQQMLDQLARRQLTAAQRNVITTINGLFASSVDAEKRGDMKTADALADRAQVLAKDLINGK